MLHVLYNLYAHAICVTFFNFLAVDITDALYN